MIIIELHDGDFTNPEFGTLVGHINSASAMEHPHQAEASLQDPQVAHSIWRRAYLLQDTTVLAVVAHGNGNWFQYVGRHPQYSGHWQLTNVYPTTNLAVAHLGIDVSNLAEATNWAILNLQHDYIASAIVVDSTGVVAAWELGQQGVIQVAQGPARH